MWRKHLARNDNWSKHNGARVRVSFREWCETNHKVSVI